MTDFGEWFISELHRIYGEASSNVSNPRICQRLSIDVSSETIRKLRNDPSYLPSPDTQQKIRDALGRVPSSSSHPNANGNDHSASQIAAILRVSQCAKQVEPLLRSPDWLTAPGAQPCDIIRKQKHTHIPLIMLYRVVDPTLLPARQDEADLAIRSLAKDFLDTYPTPPGITHIYTMVTDIDRVRPQLDALRKLGVHVQSLKEFMRSLIDVDKVQSELDDIRRSLSTKDYFDDFQVRITDDKGNVAEEDHPFAFLTRQLRSADGPVIVLVIGPYGTGKSSLLAQLADRMLQDHRADTGESIPIFLQAGKVNWLQSMPDIFRFCRETYNFGELSFESFHDLTETGALTFFVDGLDEHPDLRDARFLGSILNTQLLEGFASGKGRLILSLREELFSTADEEAQFEKYIRNAVQSLSQNRAKVIKVETTLFDEASLKRFLRGRRMRITGAAEILNLINGEPALHDIARRPIFASLLASLKVEDIRKPEGLKISDLFQKYTSQWCSKEQSRLQEIILDAAEREAWCEAAAQFLAERDLLGTYSFSIDELDQFVALQAKSYVRRQSIDEFRKDAQIAMFLERVDTDERELGVSFRFSHRALFDFFLAKAIVRQLEAGNGHRFDLLSKIRFEKSNRVLPIFVKQMLYDRSRYFDKDIEEYLEEYLAWGSDGKNTRVGGTFDISVGEYVAPPFGPGGKQNLLGNLCCLLSIDDLGRTRLTHLRLRGASFAGADLSAISPDCLRAFDFEGTNLESVRFPGDFTLPISDRYLRLPESSEKSEDHLNRIRQFMSKYQVAQYSRFFAAAHADRARASERIGKPHLNLEWVIVPGGEYVVRPEGVGTRKIEVKVRVSSFLIQRYPVTNGQFWQFLRESDYWNVREARRRDRNDYYLGGWSESPDTDAALDQKWKEMPVVYVSWYAARDFAHSQGLRLPTEIEWEIAARLFHQNAGFDYQWSTNEISTDWVLAKGPDDTNVPLVPEFSVFDDPPKFREWLLDTGADIPSHLIGGVREWVLDCFDSEYPYPDGPESRLGLGEPVLNACNSGYAWGRGSTSRWHRLRGTAEYMVLRGGSFQKPLSEVKIHMRSPQRPTNVNPDAGFRCILPLRALRV